MKYVLVFGALMVLAACGQQQASNTYPPQYELNFMRSCQAQAPSALCACTWEKIEQNIPVRDFAAFEVASPNEQANHPLTQQIRGYALECRDAAAGGGAVPATP